MRRSSRMETMSVSDARAIALGAQRLRTHAPDAAAAPPRRAAAAALLRTTARLGALQIDAVNVLERAHYLPLFSRHGVYARSLLDDAAYGQSRKLFEYWGHQASLLPMELFPLFRWRMDRAARLQGIYGGIAKFVKKRRAFVDAVLREVESRGPLGAGELSVGAPRKGGWWGWSDAKAALEWLFWAGRVTTRTRRAFERVYDLTERVVPSAIFARPAPSAPDAQRELLRLSARALGIATEDDLADYFRLRLREVRPRIDELVEEGTLERVRVESSTKPLLLARGAERTRAREPVRALVSPFDPLVWYRARAERLFGFRYRIEIYTPAHLREHGYYVLPFVLGDRVAARVDLKADRAASALLVQAAHLEPGADAASTAHELAHELRLVADWLGLERVRVSRRGSLARVLAREAAQRLVKRPVVRAGDT